MITLYQLPTAFGLPVSVSPYCSKLEAYFRLAGHEYQVEDADLRKSPNKKVPYIAWPDGRIVADSGEIIRQLESKNPRLGIGLSENERAQGAELEALAQGPVYFACLYARFVEENGWRFQKETVKAILPVLLAPILVPLIRRSQRKLCEENDFNSRDDYPKAIAAIEKISETLGDNLFMLGDEPGVVDCSVWANIMHVAYTLADNPARHAVRGDESLMAYVRRVADRVDFSLPALS